MTTKDEIKKRQLQGTVVSDKMQKTVIVLVERYVKHPKYGKFSRVSKRFKAHDEAGDYKVGDKVMIEECRPIARDKHFRVVGKI